MKDSGRVFRLSFIKKEKDAWQKSDLLRFPQWGSGKTGIHIQAYCEGKVWAEEDNEELRSYCMKGQLEYEIHQNVPDELTERSGKVLLISYEEAKLKAFQKEMFL